MASFFKANFFNSLNFIVILRRNYNFFIIEGNEAFDRKRKRNVQEFVILGRLFLLQFERTSLD